MLRHKLAVQEGRRARQLRCQVVTPDCSDEGRTARTVPPKFERIEKQTRPSKLERHGAVILQGRPFTGTMITVESHVTEGQRRHRSEASPHVRMGWEHARRCRPESLKQAVVDRDPVRQRSKAGGRMERMKMRARRQRGTGH